jgi:hypothetical protein
MHQSWTTLFHDIGNLIALATAALNLAAAFTARNRHAATGPEGDRRRRRCRHLDAKPQQAVRAEEFGRGSSSTNR